MTDWSLEELAAMDGWLEEERDWEEALLLAEWALELERLEQEEQA